MQGISIKVKLLQTWETILASPAIWQRTINSIILQVNEDQAGKIATQVWRKWP